MGSNAAGFAALDAQIRRLRAVPGLARQAAPEVAVAFEAELGKQIAAGQGPDGQLLKLTADGRTPLRGAAGGLSVRAVGAVIVARLTPPWSFHNRGQTRGNVRRQILPSRNLTGPLVRAVEVVLGRKFVELVGGRRRGG